MDPGDLFGTIVVLAIGGIILLTLGGYDSSVLLDILPEVVIVAFFLAIVLAFAQALQ